VLDLAQLRAVGRQEEELDPRPGQGRPGGRAAGRP
jgi:hypothetical protein